MNIKLNIHIYIWITLVNPHGSTAAAAIDGGPVGRARKPSRFKLTVWCIYSASGLSCQRAKCARLSKGVWLCAGSSCPTNMKAAPDNVHISILEFEAPARWPGRGAL